MSLSGINPIWWGQFHLQGGLRKVGLRTLLYAGLLLGVFLVACRLAKPAPPSIVAGYSLYVVGFAQLIMVLPVWASRIHRAVLNDTTANMIESHRLSPMSGLAAVAGFVLGPSLQLLALIAVNFVTGAILATFGVTGLAGALLSTWVLAHVYIAFVAAFIWTGALLCSFCFGKQGNLVMVFLMILVVGGWRIVEVVPGLGLLCGTEMIGYCQGVITGKGPTGLPKGAAFSVVCQLLMMALWIRAAARKFERPDLPAFSVFWASLFYAGWIGLAALGLARTDALRLDFLEFDIAFEAQFVSTLGLTLLLLVLPIRSAAMISQRWRQQHQELAGPKPFGPLLVGAALAIAAALIIGGMPLRFQIRGWFSNDTLLSRLGLGQWLWTAACLTLAALSLAALYRTAFALKWKRPDGIVVVYVVLIWAGLPIIDSVVHAYLDAASSSPTPGSSFLTACSPVGGLIQTWIPPADVNWRGGLLFQGALCAILVGLQFWIARRTNPRSAG